MYLLSNNFTFLLGLLEHPNMMDLILCYGWHISFMMNVCARMKDLVLCQLVKMLVFR